MVRCVAGAVCVFAAVESLDGLIAGGVYDPGLLSAWKASERGLAPRRFVRVARKTALLDFQPARRGCRVLWTAYGGGGRAGRRVRIGGPACRCLLWSDVLLD